MIEPTIAYRRLGRSALSVSPIGLGCMSLSGAYGEADDAASEQLIHHALDRGVNHLDSSDMYGWGHNEGVIGKAIRSRRSEVVLTTKFGWIKREDGTIGISGTPAHVHEACEASLRRLGVDVIDLYYQHRVDPDVPIEETVGAMAELVHQGKVRFLGLSEANGNTIARAHAIHPIAAVQSEYSILSREDAEETRKTTTALGVSFVAYAPLGRGLLTGAIKVASDVRGPLVNFPRFQGGNLASNRRLAEPIEEMASAKGCTAAQITIAWLLAQGDDIVTIPGTRFPARLDENLGALSVALSPAELERLSSAIPVGAAAGTRYPEAAMASVHN